MAIPLEWKASITGIEDVKNKLAEIREEYQRGQIGVQELGEKQRFLSRQAKTVNQTMATQKSLFLALHPSIGKVSNAMSIFGSVSRSALSIMNALNLATLASQGFNQQISDINVKIIEQRKRLSELSEAGFGPGDAAFDEAIALMKEYEAALAAINKEAESQATRNLFTDIVGLGLAAGVTVQTIIKILPFLKNFNGLLARLPALALGAAAIPAAFIGLPALFFAASVAISEFLVGLFNLDEWRQNNGRLLEKFFLETLPKAVFTGVNIIINAFEKMVNSAIAVLNALIRAINKIPGINIGRISDIKLPRLGESGGGGGSPGGNSPLPFPLTNPSVGQTVVINVGGSIISEHELETMTSNALKAKLKRSGFG